MREGGGNYVGALGNNATSRAYLLACMKEMCPRGNNKVIIYFLIS